MQSLDKDTCNSFDVSECTSSHCKAKLNLAECCEVLIDYRTCLSPPPGRCSDICTTSCVDVKIDAVCGSKVLIDGVVHKTIKYTTTDCDNRLYNHTKHKDIPFSCYVDFDCEALEGNFKIGGHEIICQFSDVKKIKENCSIKSIFIEKEIIKISVQSD